MRIKLLMIVAVLVVLAIGSVIFFLRTSQSICEQHFYRQELPTAEYHFSSGGTIADTSLGRDIIKLGEDAVPYLLERLYKEGRFNPHAIVLLGEIRSKKATLPLLDALQEAPQENMSFLFIIDALRKIDDRRATKHIRGLLDENSPFSEKQVLAARTLAEMDDSYAHSFLFDILTKSPRYDSQIRAAHGLAMLGDSLGVLALILFTGPCDGPLDYWDRASVSQRLKSLIEGLSAEVLKTPERSIGEYTAWQIWWKENGRFLLWDKTRREYRIDGCAKGSGYPIDAITGKRLTGGELAALELMEEDVRSHLIVPTYLGEKARTPKQQQ